MTNHCRIGKITYKNKPHLVEIRPTPRGLQIMSNLSQFAETIISNYPNNDMAGFAIVTWAFDGTFSRGTSTHKDSPVGVTMMPSYVSDVLRRDTAADVFRDIMECRP